MGEYSKFISPLRRSVPTPKDMVKDGKCVFGTFDKEFETMELLKIDKPSSAPNFLNRFKLTLWQATEVNFDEGVLLTACCDMGLFGTVLNIFYDKSTKKVTSWKSMPSSKDTHIAPNVLNGAQTHAEGKDFKIRFTNNLQDGRFELTSEHKLAESGEISYALKLSRLSKPGVVSIPFADMNKRHRPLYSQKDFFKAEGSITVNGKTYTMGETATAIVDDHRGYYPRRAHYDWVTTMGLYDRDGVKKWFAFNLTRNQSIDQHNYNENLIWFENEISLLPPVVFTRDVQTTEFKDHARWHVADEHDMVNLDFDVYDLFRMQTHAKPIANIDYFITFGTLSGYVRDEDGNKYILDGMTGIGEDKTLLL